MNIRKLFERLWFSRINPEPHAALKKDYEVLIRLARRCAYDLNHVVDHLPSGHYYLTDFGFDQRARYWVDLFAKGNPGKDYRQEIMRELEQREEELREALAANKGLRKLCRDNGINPPAELCVDPDIPF